MWWVGTEARIGRGRGEQAVTREEEGRGRCCRVDAGVSGRGGVVCEVCQAEPLPKLVAPRNRLCGWHGRRRSAAAHFPKVPSPSVRPISYFPTFFTMVLRAPVGGGGPCGPGRLAKPRLQRAVRSLRLGHKSRACGGLPPRRRQRKNRRGSGRSTPPTRLQRAPAQHLPILTSGSVPVCKRMALPASRKLGRKQTTTHGKTGE